MNQLKRTKAFKSWSFLGLWTVCKDAAVMIMSGQRAGQRFLTELAGHMLWGKQLHTSGSWDGSSIAPLGRLNCLWGKITDSDQHFKSFFLFIYLILHQEQVGRDNSIFLKTIPPFKRLPTDQPLHVAVWFLILMLTSKSIVGRELWLWH